MALFPIKTLLNVSQTPLGAKGWLLTFHLMIIAPAIWVSDLFPELVSMAMIGPVDLAPSDMVVLRKLKDDGVIVCSLVAHCICSSSAVAVYLQSDIFSSSGRRHSGARWLLLEPLTALLCCVFLTSVNAMVSQIPKHMPCRYDPSFIFHALVLEKYDREHTSYMLYIYGAG